MVRKVLMMVGRGREGCEAEKRANGTANGAFGSTGDDIGREGNEDDEDDEHKQREEKKKKNKVRYKMAHV